MKTSNVVVVLGGMALAGFVLASGDASPTAPAVVVPADLTAKAEAVRPLLAQLPAEDRAELARFWTSLAWSVANLDVITTTTQARNVHDAVGPKRVNVAKVPGLKEALEKFTAEAVGTEQVKLDPAKRQRVAEAFNALAIAAGG